MLQGAKFQQSNLALLIKPRGIKRFVAVLGETYDSFDQMDLALGLGFTQAILVLWLNFPDS